MLDFGLDLVSLAQQCAPQVHPTTTHALVRVESGGNPYAIGVVGGALVRQPRNLAEALATVRALDRAGVRYSVGLGQITSANFPRLNLSAETAFDPCTNLRAMQTILGECYQRASRRAASDVALGQALSCYYSGNFETGYRHGYVQRVVAAARPPP